MKENYLELFMFEEWYFYCEFLQMAVMQSGVFLLLRISVSLIMEGFHMQPVGQQFQVIKRILEEAGLYGY